MSSNILNAEAISVDHSSRQLNTVIPLNASKSETNRALVMRALCNEEINLENLAIARDSETMQRLLADPQAEVWDVLDAGTTMRFLTGYLAIKGNGKSMTGTDRMQQRPIKPLVDALRLLGADISYLKNDGYPPLSIQPIRQQLASEIQIPGNISSQYISALLMIAPILPKGLKIELTTEIFSRPYIEMTLGLMSRFGIRHSWSGQTIEIKPQNYHAGSYQIESDWSGASYWYSIAALTENPRIKLLGLRKDSFQGDHQIARIMEGLGVTSTFESDGVVLTQGEVKSDLTIDFRECPDLAQTVMAAASVKGVKLEMTGLESLKIKETDRIAAMRTELRKVGGDLIEENNIWILMPGGNDFGRIEFDSYEDHRMAMALAPLGLIHPVVINEPKVVVKSYPDYWTHLQLAGFRLETV